MNVFIIGGSGYIGRSVTRQILAEGHNVTALARSETSAARLPMGAVRVVRGTVGIVEREGRNRGPEHVHRQGGVGELSVQPEVYVNCQSVVIGVPEVLPPGIRGREYVSVHQTRVLGESALRAEDADR